jgi:hypothetical protein
LLSLVHDRPSFAHFQTLTFTCTNHSFVFRARRLQQQQATAAAELAAVDNRVRALVARKDAQCKGLKERVRSLEAEQAQTQAFLRAQRDRLDITGL